MMPNDIRIRFAVLPQCTGQTDARTYVRTYGRTDRPTDRPLESLTTIGRCAPRATRPYNNNNVSVVLQLMRRGFTVSFVKEPRQHSKAPRPERPCRWGLLSAGFPVFKVVTVLFRSDGKGPDRHTLVPWKCAMPLCWNVTCSLAYLHVKAAAGETGEMYARCSISFYR